MSKNLITKSQLSYPDDYSMNQNSVSLGCGLLGALLGDLLGDLLGGGLLGDVLLGDLLGGDFLGVCCCFCYINKLVDERWNFAASYFTNRGIHHQTKFASKAKSEYD